MAGRPARPRSGAVLAGVCAALPQRSGTTTSRVRRGAALSGSIGAREVVHLALWLLVPKDRA